MYIFKIIFFARAFLICLHPLLSFLNSLFLISLTNCNGCGQPLSNVEPWGFWGVASSYSIFMFSQSCLHFKLCSPKMKTATWTLKSANHTWGIAIYRWFHVIFTSWFYVSKNISISHITTMTAMPTLTLVTCSGWLALYTFVIKGCGSSEADIGASSNSSQLRKREHIFVQLTVCNITKH